MEATTDSTTQMSENTEVTTETDGDSSNGTGENGNQVDVPNDGSGDAQSGSPGDAMGNAAEDVMSAASYVTTSVDENGVYNALKHFNII